VSEYKNITQEREKEKQKKTKELGH